MRTCFVGFPGDRGMRRRVVILASLALGTVAAGAGFLGCGSDDTSPIGARAPDQDASAGPVDSGGDAAHPSDAGGDATVTCTPTVPGSPSWKSPAGYPMAACSATEISTLIADCYGATYDKAKCEGDRTTMGACWACMVTDESATALGPLIHQGDFSTVNYPGCIAIEQANRTPAGCGAHLGIALDCQMVACANPCSGLDAGGPSKVAAYNACLDQVVADGGVCASYAADTTACPGSDPSYATCYRNADTFAVYAGRVATLFCGGGGDGGTDAGTDGEAGVTDAATDATSDAPADAPDAD
jgi:hypothetical protein